MSLLQGDGGDGVLLAGLSKNESNDKRENSEFVILSNDPDVLGLLAFLCLFDFEDYSPVFLQGFRYISLNRTV